MTPAFEIARQVVREEADALARLAGMLGEGLQDVIEVLRGSTQVIVTGLGKSGLIAQKIAATLTSTGAPAQFMHPVEALHGDLGRVAPEHCLIALSRSGTTEEVVRFVVHFRRLGGPVIAITQRRDSRLAELATHVVLLPDLPEAGPLQLAPTTSCLMQLAIGDGLAMALLHARGFQPSDFAQYHPEGALGRRLLLRARDLMHAGEKLPRVLADDSFDHLLVEMARKQLGLALIVEHDGRLVGTFTDGDLRRILERVDNPRGLDARSAHARSRRSTQEPRVAVSVVPAARPAVDCLQFMREGQITSLIVADEASRPIGVLRLMDLVNAGLA
jgi:arabinose-5-phosphate isomerase